MKDVGLSDRELELIHGVLKRHPAVTKAILFGSRAKLTHQKQSDIDSLSAESIAAELDELPLPYRFDVKGYSDIQSTEMQDHVQRVGKVVYVKNESS
jgi:predicted nucleotidyltransferase